MIKLDDKVICIENYNGARKFLANKTYIISSMNKEEVYVRTETNIVNSGCWFSIKDSFYNYFIPLAELREKQIKSVLDD